MTATRPAPYTGADEIERIRRAAQSWGDIDPDEAQRVRERALSRESETGEQSRDQQQRGGGQPSVSEESAQADLSSPEHPASVRSVPAARGPTSPDSPSSQAPGGPTLDPAALHGIAGKVVRTLDPHTEADPAAILLTFLAAAGNIIGPGPQALAEAARHPARLFVVLVGETSRARKGSAWQQVRRVLAEPLRNGKPPAPSAGLPAAKL